MKTSLKMADLERICTRRKSSVERAGPCPFCSLADEDGFLFWLDIGNFYCRQCGTKGFAADAPGSYGNANWPPEERERFIREAQERASQRIAARAEERRTALQQLRARANLVEQYQADLRSNGHVEWWLRKGLTTETIERYRLGYCPSCPTYPLSASYTIPVTYQGELYNLRHRLEKPNGMGKYRPEVAGLGAAMFNADVLNTPHKGVILVEGEIKTMVLDQIGYNVVGIPGANIFKPKWSMLFEKQEQVYVVMDPGAERQSAEIADRLGEKACVVHLPVKPDDFFVVYSGTMEQFESYLAIAKRAR